MSCPQVVLWCRIADAVLDAWPLAHTADITLCFFGSRSPLPKLPFAFLGLAHPWLILCCFCARPIFVEKRWTSRLLSFSGEAVEDKAGGHKPPRDGVKPNRFLYTKCGSAFNCFSGDGSWPHSWLVWACWIDSPLLNGWSFMNGWPLSWEWYELVRWYLKIPARMPLRVQKITATHKL